MEEPEVADTRVNVIVFDFNDTISPSNFTQGFKLYESELGMPANELVKAYVDNGLLRSLMLGEFGSESEFLYAVSQLTGVEFSLLARIADHVAASREMDENVMQLVRALREKYKLVLLTDNILETFNFWVDKFSLQLIFDVIINSADHGMLKSDPAMYALVLRTLNARSQEVLLVDDDSLNLRVAESAGIRTVHFVDAYKLERFLVENRFLERAVLC